jgi:hypothetical protein
MYSSAIWQNKGRHTPYGAVKNVERSKKKRQVIESWAAPILHKKTEISATRNRGFRSPCGQFLGPETCVNIEFTLRVTVFDSFQPE